MDNIKKWTQMLYAIQKGKSWTSEIAKAMRTKNANVVRIGYRLMHMELVKRIKEKNNNGVYECIWSLNPKREIRIDTILKRNYPDDYSN